MIGKNKLQDEELQLRVFWLKYRTGEKVYVIGEKLLAAYKIKPKLEKTFEISVAITGRNTDELKVEWINRYDEKTTIIEALKDCVKEIDEFISDRNWK